MSSARSVPRTDTVLADPLLAEFRSAVHPAVVKAAVHAAQQRVRTGDLNPEGTAAAAAAALGTRPRSVLNGTGVVVHTNLGRAPLAPEAVAAVVEAAGYTDVEYDRGTGSRAPRGREALQALRLHTPRAGDVHVVNNGAAALLLAVTVLAPGREVIISRGEMVEIGDGFRIHELIQSTGATLREVGTTNRTKLADYAEAVGPDTGCILKVHPSNFRVTGFTSGASVSELAGLDAPLLVDIGSGLLAPHRLLRDEPDADTVLREGATLVTASGDKLLGGPQAGLLLGDAVWVQRARRHPLARALRVDKLTLAALDATLRAPATPVRVALEQELEVLTVRTRRLADALALSVTGTEAEVGGGGAPGLTLPSVALVLPEACAAALRRGTPALVARVERGRCLVDLRCIPEAADAVVVDVIARALADASGGSGTACTS